ncbi:hypothetical protein Cni_G13684 [Canna indica]|uniref:Uncharacterized protein n=1 Tax=Canna indica TaxID=4628 RepID=A0AAQ3KG79_9LILI|nr:hypothetical protein Cni_G13684 [Canna indica]
MREATTRGSGLPSDAGGDDGEAMREATAPPAVEQMRWRRGRGKGAAARIGEACPSLTVSAATRKGSRYENRLCGGSKKGNHCVEEREPRIEAREGEI